MMYRTAETLFWIGRYIERAENNARRISVNYHMRHVLSEFENERRWEKLISSLGDFQLFQERFHHANETTALQFLTFEQSNQNSLYCSTLATRNNIRSLRQLLPSELWDCINSFYLWFNKQNMDSLLDHSPYVFYQHFQDWLCRFNGIADSTMVRDNVWNFIQAGKFFERTENALRILHNYYLTYATNIDTSDSDNYNRYILLLKSAGGYEAFRKLYADDVTFEKVMTFLILHPSFPRSVQYTLSQLEHCLTDIKQQDYQFHILAETAKTFVDKMQGTLEHLQHDNDPFSGLSFAHMMFQCVNKLGVEISNTFFQEDFIS